MKFLFILRSYRSVQDHKSVQESYKSARLLKPKPSFPKYLILFLYPWSILIIFLGFFLFSSVSLYTNGVWLVPGFSSYIINLIWDFNFMFSPESFLTLFFGYCISCWMGLIFIWRGFLMRFLRSSCGFSWTFSLILLNSPEILFIYSFPIVSMNSFFWDLKLLDEYF